jgi:hypothetical protein
MTEVTEPGDEESSPRAGELTTDSTEGERVSVSTALREGFLQNLEETACCHRKGQKSVSCFDEPTSL